MMIVYLISGLDDLFVDLLFFAMKAKQWSGGNSSRHRPSLEEMAEKREQRFALMFPAWQEADVIRRALLNTITNIDYRNFHVFVATYVNDPDTQREVEEVMRHHANVTQLIVPHPDPTCKADCLNWIVRGIREYEDQHCIRFAGVILHDAEDVVDTLSLKLFNCLMPESGSRADPDHFAKAAVVEPDRRPLYGRICRGALQGDPRVCWHRAWGRRRRTGYSLRPRHPVLTATVLQLTA